jgi:hypothetical protein
MPEFQTNAGTTWERTAVVIHAVAPDRFETSWEYTPVSVASAPSGWRAIYKVEKPEPGEPDWMAVPLIGWGSFISQTT